MVGAGRIVAAALAAAAVVVLGAVLASAAGGAGTAAVTLQVAPRGPGTVTATPAAPGDDGRCSGQSGTNDCEWRYERGTTVKLTAAEDAGAGNSFAGWSDASCGTSRTCSVKLDDDVTTVVATFSPLMLGVVFSNGNASNASVTFDPPGQPCANPPGNADSCRQYPAHTRVRLTAKPGSKPFTEWNENPNGVECLPRNQPTCTIGVDDQPTWAGARFGTEPAPGLATTITVEFKLLKGGDGSGRVTTTKLDCGNACSSSFGYGRTLTLTAKPEDGSTFDGWNGVCDRGQTTCTLAVGPITFVKASFTRDGAPPTAPSGLAVAQVTRTSIALGWKPSTDNVGVKGYRVYVDGVAAGDTSDSSYTVDGLKCGRSYAVAVDAVDANGNRSQRAALGASTQPCALAARLAGVGVKVSGRVRTLIAQVRVNNPTQVRLRLVCGPRTVATRSFRAVPGTNPLRLGVPRSVTGRGCRLAVTVGGGVALPARRVLLPRAR